MPREERVTVILKVNMALVHGLRVPTFRTIFGGGSIVIEPWLGVPTLVKVTWFVRALKAERLVILSAVTFSSFVSK